MFFITCRMPTVNTEPALNTDFQFDLGNNAPGRAFFCCRRVKKDRYEEIGSDGLLTELKQSKYKQVLLYIHGFANLPEDVFNAVEEMQGLCNRKKKDEVLVVPVIWPCDAEKGLVSAYWSDEKSADASAYAFGRMFERFMFWRNSALANPSEDPCTKRINLLAHSMGNRVLRHTLELWNKHDQKGGLPLLFRNTFMIAADVLNESLHKGQPGELISHTSRNVVVYFASDDLALRASKIANVANYEASRRLGHTGPEDMDLTPKNVYAIDCDEVNTLYDNPKGHSYFRSGKKKGEPGVVFDHLWETITTGRVFPNDETRKSSILRLKK